MRADVNSSDRRVTDKTQVKMYRIEGSKEKRKKGRNRTMEERQGSGKKQLNN
jgi:hypothetical protein